MVLLQNRINLALHLIELIWLCILSTLLIDKNPFLLYAHTTWDFIHNVIKELHLDIVRRIHN